MMVCASAATLLKFLVLPRVEWAAGLWCWSGRARAMAASRVLAAVLCCLAIAHGEGQTVHAGGGAGCRPMTHGLQQRVLKQTRRRAPALPLDAGAVEVRLARGSGRAPACLSFPPPLPPPSPSYLAPAAANSCPCRLPPQNLTSRDPPCHVPCLCVQAAVQIPATNSSETPSFVL